MTAPAKPLPPHGTTPKNFYNKRRRVLVATGRWDPWTEAQPVRNHIADLGEHGIGWMRAAELASLSTATVSRWLYGNHGYPPPRKIKADLAAKMLAVRADDNNLADRALVDSLVAVRQIKALAADGFPFTYLGKRLGRDATNMSRTLHKTRIEAGSARAINDLYAELAGTDPAAAGISPRAITYVRGWSAKKGWLTSAAWDGEITNPDADPQSWMRHDTRRSYEALVEDFEFIIHTTGATLAQAADRLGVCGDTLWKARKEMAA